MCKGTINGEDVFIVKKDDMHDSIKHHYSRDNISVDKCIGEEIQYLLQNGVATLGHSCCGHGKTHAQAIIYPEYQLQARLLGYKVVTDRHPNWEKGRYETFIYLKSGTQNKGLF
ncbi:hypothetical protein [Oceanobacillus sp. FSL H7-0719]|uniref:hypothetical protein n=1 Tax=Oceanobacillus sp. FSL H7-0719 TaxID=2954507 RepID=UPI003250126E